MLRKPEGKNPEHAFIVVEGINAFDEVVFKRYDLVKDEASPGKAKICISRRPNVDAQDAKSVFENELLRGDMVYFKSWQISKEQAKQLDCDILKDKKDPPDYAVLGDKSISTKSQSIANGHNCFTWCREKLLNLKDAKILIPVKYTDFIAAATSLYIKDTTEEPTTSCLLL